MIVKAYSIPQQHVRVIRYGFDLSPGSVRRTARGQRLRVTVLGNLTPIKGLHDVEQSARALAPLSAGIRLTVRGGVPPGVTSIKATPYQHKDLARIMSNTDVVLIASRVAETFCRTLDEALYCGVPVVAPRIGAIPERLKHGVNGLLFEPGDWCGALACLKELSADRPLLAHLVEGARAYKRRTPDACHAEYEQIYNDLLSRS
jgi:glycosyltransferase involved in cell wall biosynthesis